MSFLINNQIIRPMKTKLIMLTIVMGLYSCQQPTNELTDAATNELTDADRERITEEIRLLTNSIFEAASRKDIDQVYANFSDKVTGAFPGTIMESWEEHKQQSAEFFAMQETVEYKIENMNIDVLSSNVAVLLGKYTFIATDTTGTTINSSSAWTYVFNKENGKWKIVHFHISDPPSPQE